MSVVEAPSGVNLIQRVQNILTKPAAEWDVIAGETASVQSLYIGYVCVLAAIPAVGQVLGSLLVGHWFVVPAIVEAILTYGLSLAGVFVVAFIIDALASSFDAQKNQIQALKLVAYANTAAWVAGVFYIIPIVGGLVVLVGGIYSLYTLYLGLPKLMKSPAEKTTGYFVVSLIAAILVNVVLAMIVGMVIGALMVGAIATGAAVGASAIH